jgi:hypothetical protein
MRFGQNGKPSFLMPRQSDVVSPKHVEAGILKGISILGGHTSLAQPRVGQVGEHGGQCEGHRAAS